MLKKVLFALVATGLGRLYVIIGWTPDIRLPTSPCVTREAVP